MGDAELPPLSGREEVLLGLEPGAAIEPPPPFEDDRKVVVYGTSITQGGCAARPGMSYTNILSRWLNLEFINLGFSGNGRGDPEVAHLMAEIENPGCFVLDYEANAAESLYDTLEPFIGILRQAHARTPALVVSRIPFARDRFSDDALRGRQERREFQQDVVDRLRKAGDEAIFFKGGEDLLYGAWEECTVDGTHPTDLGFLRMAEGLEPVLRELLFGAVSD